jgi:hypothetical protein
VAFNKLNGAVIRKARLPGGDPAHYSSCIVTNVGGQLQYIQFLGGGVVGIAARDGRFLWRDTSPANRSYEGCQCRGGGPVLDTS